MINEDCSKIYDCYKVFVENQQNLATLIGASGGGEGGNWGGSLPKLISILPMGNWKPTSLKRGKVGTKSGFTSDHYIGNTIAYAADFGLNTTFSGNVESATNFALRVAQKVDPSVKSWKPFEGNSFKKITQDGFRIQIIWLSNVGGNHYDHVHVGVKKTTGSDVKYSNQQDDVQDTEQQQNDAEQAEGAQSDKKEDGGFAAYLQSLAAPIMKDFSKSSAQKALSDVLGTTLNAVSKSTGKNFSL